MTLSEFKQKYNLSETEFEDYIERTAIMHYDGGVSMEKAHKQVLALILNKRNVKSKQSK